MKRLMIYAALGMVLSIFLMAALWFVSDKSVRELEKQNTGFQTYERSYALISQDTSDLWTTVYRSALLAATEHGVALEWVGLGSLVEYSVEDCLRIAIASGADGIILHKEATDETTDLINEAQDAGIPVITVLNDDQESRRVSFVGANSYQMGEIYGRQIVRELKDGDNNVMILVNRAADSSVSNMLYAQMKSVVEREKKSGQKVTIREYPISIATSFDAEEDIRDIFLGEEETPDIMVCVDLISTECASQALVDLNRVGDICLIGFYASGAVREALSKGVIRSTLEIDAREIGKTCIQTLEEYHELGRVSSYINIGIRMLTTDKNAGIYPSEMTAAQSQDLSEKESLLNTESLSEAESGAQQQDITEAEPET